MRYTSADLAKLGLEKDPTTGRFRKKKKLTSTVEPKKFNYKGHIWIPGHVPSLKNNKQIFQKKMPNGKKVPFITSSKAVKQYIKDTHNDYEKFRSVFHSLIKDLETPYYVCFFFVRKSKAKFDFNNANHLVTDSMVKHGWIPDDDCDTILPIPELNRKTYQVSNQNPGVWITVKKFKK